MEYQALRSPVILNGSAAFVADQPVALAIQYRGTEASATVTVASGDITLKHGAAGSEAVDNTVGSSGVVADGTYTTLGAMVDAINASPNWHAEIVDGLRSDSSTAALLARSETTLAPVRTQVLPLYLDTSAHLSLSYRISARRLNWSRAQKACQSVFKQARALVNVGSGTLVLTIYEVDKFGTVVATLATFNGTDNTELDARIAGGEGELISQVGNDLLVRYTCSVDLPDSGAYLNVAGEVRRYA